LRRNRSRHPASLPRAEDAILLPPLPAAGVQEVGPICVADRRGCSQSAAKPMLTDRVFARASWPRRGQFSARIGRGCCRNLARGMLTGGRSRGGVANLEGALSRTPCLFLYSTTSGSVKAESDFAAHIGERRPSGAAIPSERAILFLPRQIPGGRGGAATEAEQYHRAYPGLLPRAKTDPRRT